MPCGFAWCVVADHAEERLAPAGWPSMIHDALKILCRQCSEFACANIVNSTSVGLRRCAGEVGDQVIDLVRGQREAEPAFGLLDGRGARGRARPPPSAASARRDGTDRRPRRATASTVSVIRSCRSGRMRVDRPAPSRWKTVPRSMRRTKSRPHSRAMSVALDDHGEIVPNRGVTSTSTDRLRTRRAP